MVAARLCLRQTLLVCSVWSICTGSGKEEATADVEAAATSRLWKTNACRQLSALVGGDGKNAGVWQPAFAYKVVALSAGRCDAPPIDHQRSPVAVSGLCGGGGLKASSFVWQRPSLTGGDWIAAVDGSGSAPVYMQIDGKQCALTHIALAADYSGDPQLRLQFEDCGGKVALVASLRQAAVGGDGLNVLKWLCRVAHQVAPLCGSAEAVADAEAELGGSVQSARAKVLVAAEFVVEGLDFSTLQTRPKALHTLQTSAKHALSDVSGVPKKAIHVALREGSVVMRAEFKLQDGNEASIVQTKLMLSDSFTEVLGTAIAAVPDIEEASSGPITVRKPTIVKVGEDVPTPEPTPGPTPVPTAEPTATADPSPAPTPAPTASPDQQTGADTGKQRHRQPDKGTTTKSQTARSPSRSATEPSAETTEEEGDYEEDGGTSTTEYSTTTASTAYTTSQDTNTGTHEGAMENSGDNLKGAWTEAQEKSTQALSAAEAAPSKASGVWQSVSGQAQNLTGKAEGLTEQAKTKGAEGIDKVKDAAQEVQHAAQSVWKPGGWQSVTGQAKTAGAEGADKAKAAAHEVQHEAQNAWNYMKGAIAIGGDGKGDAEHESDRRLEGDDRALDLSSLLAAARKGVTRTTIKPTGEKCVDFDEMDWLHIDEPVGVNPSDFVLLRAVLGLLSQHDGLDDAHDLEADTTVQRLCLPDCSGQRDEACLAPGEKATFVMPETPTAPPQWELPLWLDVILHPSMPPAVTGRVRVYLSVSAALGVLLSCVLFHVLFPARSAQGRAMDEVKMRYSGYTPLGLRDMGLQAYANA
eukprot:TRINITY_DN74579_c0_g1_i1.p1 TRINITY_DN74579_c0_g1~~TRINITY_DN74579_c0_g1_i1.p1  ORF type:complete len:808 (-),score=159.54 TRINITY_DN74579_c0_g1_i1:71-2494(-)